MSKRPSAVPRPVKRSEFLIRFGTRNAERGWRDLLATQRSAVVDAWDYLTRTPTQRDSRNHRLKGDLAVVRHDGKEHERWQHELSNGARIWFYVEDDVVVLVECHTHHPNATK